MPLGDRQLRLFSAETGRYGGFPPSGRKIQKTLEIGVDSAKGPRLYTPHNEGGSPLATLKFALVDAKSREPRERHSTGPEAKSSQAHDTAFCRVCSLTTEY
jgi:hypothetical protein